MKKFAATVAVLAALGTVAALAQQTPPAATPAPAAAPAAPPAPAAAPAAVPAPPAPPTPRQAVMRSNRETQAAINEIVIGVMDPAALKTKIQTLIDNGAQTAILFAPGTDQNDPRAKPEIWTNAAGFKAANDKFIADVRKVTAAIPDRIALATAMRIVGEDCAACHAAFRVAPAQPEGGRGRGGRGRGAAEAAAAAPEVAAPAAVAN